MKVTKIHAAVVAALTGASGLTYQAAHAQDALEEIVVTAMRREQNLQEVPVSIVAITGDNLQMRGLDNLEEVSQGVPNVVITGGGGGTGGTNFRMRGIPNVGTYVDGIWQVGTSGFLNQEFVEIDRVEVLRGPQGTNLGRDSVGGAVMIWTKRPAEEFGGEIQATTGSYDRADVRASVNVPLGENVQSKWTAASMTRDGYIYSRTTGDSGGDLDQTVLRGDIVWDATDKLSFRFNLTQDESEFTEPRVQDALFRTFDDPAPTWTRHLIGLPEMYTYVGTDFRGQAVEPFFDPRLQVAGYPGGVVGEWENRSNQVLPSRYETEQLAIETSWDITDNMSLRFLTGQTSQLADSVVDWDNSQYDLVLDMNRSDLDVFSQDIQLTGGNDRVEWLAGVYYWDQEMDARNGRWMVNEFQKGYMDPNVVFAQPVCNPPGAVMEPIPPGPPGSPPPNPNNRRFVAGTTGVVQSGLYAGQTVQLGGNPANRAGAWVTCQELYYGSNGIGGAFDNMSRSGQDGWAVFGEATIHLTDTWDLTIGLRQHDQSGYTVNGRAIAGVTPAKPLDPTQFHVGDPFAFSDNPATYTPFQFDKLTSRLVLQKEFNDGIMGYASYSEGFNSGGVSAAVINNVRTLFPYEPSTLENFELGMRMDLADGKVRFNWTVFDTAWIDLQALGVVADPATGVQIPQLLTTNVGEAEAQGLEVELSFLPTNNFQVNVGFGLLDTGYTQINPGTASGHLPLTTGTEFELAPEESYTVGFQHIATMRSGGTWTSRLDYNYQGQFWRSAPFLRVDAYEAVPSGFEESGDWGILNARFVYEPAEGNWEAAFFGTNLTDEYTLNSGFFHGIWGYDFATVGRPREAGATLTFRF
jgi:iron complex outermembrane receptor protein